MGIYKAPVINTRYRKVVNHFHFKPQSYATEARPTESEVTSIVNSSVGLRKVKNLNNTYSTIQAHVQSIKSREFDTQELKKRKDSKSRYQNICSAGDGSTQELLDQNLAPGTEWQQKKAQREASYQQYYEQKVIQKRAQDQSQYRSRQNNSSVKGFGSLQSSVQTSSI